MIDKNHEQVSLSSLIEVAMLWEVPCEDVSQAKASSTFLFQKESGRWKGKGRTFLTMFSCGHFWRGVSLSFARKGPHGFYLEQWLDLGFQKGLSDWGAQNLDRFQPLLERGSATLWQQGLAPDCLARRGPL